MLSMLAIGKCMHRYAGQPKAADANADAGSMTASHILIFHHPSSRSVRIVWLCDELGLKYDVDVIKVCQRTCLRRAADPAMILGCNRERNTLVNAAGSERN